MVKRVLSVVGVIFLYFLIMFIGTMGFQILGEGRLPLTADQFINYSAEVGKVMTALFAVWFSHKKGISKDLDSRKNRSFIKMIVVAVFSICIGRIFFESFVGFVLNGILPVTEDIAPNKTVFDYIVAILIAPVTEEYFFRKGLYGYVREKLNIPIAVILTSLIFSVLHGYHLQGFLSVFFSGILFALIYSRPDLEMESMSPTTRDGTMPAFARKSQPESHAMTVVSAASKKPLTTSAA